MFIELVGLLRCVRPHELTWLVATAEQVEARDIVTGELGCPICHARYPIVAGVADFTRATPGDPPAGTPWADAPRDLALRAAALLDLASPGGVAVLAGQWAAAAAELAEMLDGVALLTVNAGDVPLPAGPVVSALRAHAALPLRPESYRGIALDAAHAAPEPLAEAAAALRRGGRLIAPAAAPLPAGVRELARDAWHWVAVAEEGSAAPLVPLARAPHSAPPG